MVAFFSRNLWIPFGTSFFISIGLTPIIIKFAKIFGFLDKPQRSHPAILHKKTVPRAGGVAMFISFFIVSLIFTKHNQFLEGILITSFINVFVGTLDDKFNLSPWLRLITLTLSAGIITFVGIQFYIGNPFGPGILYFNVKEIAFNFFGPRPIIIPADFLLIIWLVWMANMVNWSKGMSQLSGISIIASLVLAAVSLKFQAGNPAQIQTATLCFILAGSVLGFLPFNFPPERMMPGFGASTFIGMNLGILSILSGGKLAAAILVLGIPTVDGIIAIIRRIYSGKLPIYGDREHLYHKLLDLGFSKCQIILLSWLFTALLGILALNLKTEGKFFAIITITILVSAFFMILNYLVRRLKKQEIK